MVFNIYVKIILIRVKGETKFFLVYNFWFWEYEEYWAAAVNSDSTLWIIIGETARTSSNPTTTVFTPTRKKTATPTTVISPLSQAAKLPPKLLPNTSRLPHGVVLPSAINKPTNGKANTGRLSFPDCKMHDLPFFPVESMLLRLCNAKGLVSWGTPRTRNTIDFTQCDTWLWLTHFTLILY